MRTGIFIALVLALTGFHANAQSTSCDGESTNDVKGLVNGRIVSDGTVLGFARMNINIDGYAKAYHPKNAEAGALIHLCNAGKVFRPNGASYHGSESNATCVGKFMQDVKRIGDAGWKDTSVGVVEWYGILGQETVVLKGKTVGGVRPVMQKDGSGFYVSPTAFADEKLADQTDQRRYVNPLRVPAAVIPRGDVLASKGVKMGTFGVAIHRTKRIAVPFVVGDRGPRVGEGTPALARSLAGLPITDDITRDNRFAGQVDNADVLWVFFGENGPMARYDHTNEQALVTTAKEAFEKWGGQARLEKCLQ